MEEVLYFWQKMSMKYGNIYKEFKDFSQEMCYDKIMSWGRQI